MEKLGYCGKCDQWLIMDENWLPEHNDLHSEHCSQSRYSPGGTKYRVMSLADAKEMAKEVSDDTTECLSRSRWHSGACGDGKECAEERKRRAQALAQYVLEPPEEREMP